MDFTLALTHFCDLHGPKTVLCTQVCPLECTLCIPPSPSLRNKSSFESYETQVQDEQDSQSETRYRRRMRRTDTDFTLTSDFSSHSTAVGSYPSPANIEAHELFRRNDCSAELAKTTYDKSRDACASCSFTVPSKVAAMIPEGAPGSLADGGKSKTGPPVLRSREFVCLGKGRKKNPQDEPSSSQDSQDSSLGSFGSAVSHGNCHDHTLTYLTSKEPDDQETFAKLGKSVIRALSCEVLPRGMSEGPFCFGDTTSGYTIAYVFRLTDPKARGRRRAYAFVALAGKDAHRAFKACPMLWDAFATMSKTIEQAAQRYQDEQEVQQQRARDEELSKETKAGYTPISSFLTQRPRDPDGQPRRAGQTQPRSLAEIIGDENIFAILHQYFVHVLRCLGDRFGGMPLADNDRVVYQTSANEDEGLPEDKYPARVSTDIMAKLSLDDEVEKKLAQPKSKPKSGEPATSTSSNVASNTSTSTVIRPTVSDRPSSRHSNTGSTRTIKRNSQCADTSAVDVSRPRQVAV